MSLKRKDRYFFIGMSVLLAAGVFYAIFINPNFYEQYQVSKHDEITDVTKEERRIIEQNLDFLIPESAEITRIIAPLRPQEAAFYMTFSMPAVERAFFLQGLSGVYEQDDTGGTEAYAIEAEGEKLVPVHCYNHKSHNFTAIYEYPEKGGRVWFHLIYTDYPDQLHGIFYKRIRIMPEWLLSKAAPGKG